MNKCVIVNKYSKRIDTLLKRFINVSKNYTLSDHYSEKNNKISIVICSYEWFIKNKHLETIDYIVILEEYDGAIISELSRFRLYGYFIDDGYLIKTLQTVLDKYQDERENSSNIPLPRLLENRIENFFLAVGDSNFNLKSYNNLYYKKFIKDEPNKKLLINSELNNDNIINTIFNSINLDIPWNGVIREYTAKKNIIKLQTIILPIKRCFRKTLILMYGTAIKHNLTETNLKNTTKGEILKNNISSASFSFTSSGKITEYSYAKENFLHYQPNDIVDNKNFYDIVSAEKTAFIQHLKKQLALNQTLTLELDLISKKEIITPVLCIFYQYKKDKIQMYKCIALNMIYYKEHESRFNMIIQNISEYIYSVRYENNKVVSTYHSPKCVDITGYSPLEYMNDDKLWLNMIYPDDRELVENFFQVNNDNVGTNKIEHRIIRKDGSIRWILNTFSSTSSNGHIQSRYGLILDITEQKLMESSLRNNEQHFRCLLENGSDIIAQLSMDASILYISSSIRKNLGLDPDKLIGTSYLDLIHPEDKYIFYQSLSTLLSENGKTISIKYKILDSEGNNRIYETKETMTKDDNNTIILNSRDVTDVDSLMSKLEELALYDELTGLYNRRGFRTLADQQLKIANRTMKMCYLFFIDMDNMKIINDKYGHEMGDKALLKTRDILNATFRDSDIISRLGGDEFIALVLQTSEDTDKMMQSRLNDIINKMNIETELPCKIALSVGISSYDPKMPCSFDELLRKADQAMYYDKKSKKS